MIRIKTKEELIIIRNGGRKLATILNEVIKMVAIGVNTVDLEAHALLRMKEEGGKPAFKGYLMPDGRAFPSALITCLNNEVVHAPAVPGRILKDGDIIKIDVGFIYPVPNEANTRNNYHESGGYFTDMSKTVIVGQVDEKVQKLVDTTKESLYAGVDRVKPGNTLNDIGTAIQKHVEMRGFSVVRELVGHGVGHELHEAPQVPHYAIKGMEFRNVKLKSGMVIAIEPMVNIGDWPVKTGANGFTIETKDGSLSAHFEHSVAVTDDGFLILTEV
ncbi:MAG: type I methionyl aminopeptidase [Patescibacteria group bacterium]|nr:type I methionyl aminopeptidase [Patescibacteria group bacterium]